MTRERLLPGLAAVLLALVAVAAPAAADDLVEIDVRLADAGFEVAYVDSVPSERGSRVVVDYDSDSGSEAEYRDEAARAAELVWLHLEQEIGAIDVAPTYGVQWSDGGLPPALSFPRAELLSRYGERPEGLDRPSDAFGFDGEDLGAGFLLLAVPLLLGLAVVAGVVVVAVVLVRRHQQPVALGQQPWGQQPWGQQPWVQQPWGQQPYVGPPQASDPAGPWASPPR